MLFKDQDSNTSMEGNPMPTRKLAIQFTNTAILTALGLESCPNNSAVINQGIDPENELTNLNYPQITSFHDTKLNLLNIQ